MHVYKFFLRIGIAALSVQLSGQSIKTENLSQQIQEYVISGVPSGKTPEGKSIYMTTFQNGVRELNIYHEPPNARTNEGTHTTAFRLKDGVGLRRYSSDLNYIPIDYLDRFKQHELFGTNGIFGNRFKGATLFEDYADEDLDGNFDTAIFLVAPRFEGVTIDYLPETGRRNGMPESYADVLQDKFQKLSQEVLQEIKAYVSSR